MAFYFQHVVLGRGFAEERRRHGYVNSFAHHVIAGRMLPSLRFFAGFGSGLFASCQLRKAYELRKAEKLREAKAESARAMGCDAMTCQMGVCSKNVTEFHRGLLKMSL